MSYVSKGFDLLVEGLSTMPDTLQNVHIDPLTQLPGYDDFLRHLGERVEAGGSVGPFSIALVDIDWFGKINEAQGRAAGDIIIEMLARSLVESLDGKARVYRYGGDAFVVTFEATEKEQAFLHMERARARFDGDHVIEVDDRSAQVTLAISAGVATSPDDGPTPGDLIRRCCEALYRAKVSGRNRVCIAREEKMVTKTTHYTQGQLEGLSRLAKREGMNEAALLREALDDLLRKHNS